MKRKRKGMSDLQWAACQRNWRLAQLQSVGSFLKEIGMPLTFTGFQSTAKAQIELLWEEDKRKANAS